MEKLFERIWDLVRQVPFGKVTTYGRLALLAGNPRLARAGGYALHSAPADVPCHRVVNRLGELSPAFSPMGRESHRLLLEKQFQAEPLDILLHLVDLFVRCHDSLCLLYIAFLQRFRRLCNCPLTQLSHMDKLFVQ